MRNLLFLFLCIPSVTPGQPITESIPLKWSAEIGRVTYRTEPVVIGTRLFVGSNGLQLNDYYHEDGNGVAVIDGVKGAVFARLGNDAWGDLDVNGIVALGDEVFFGNDNDEFLCYNGKTLELIWRIPTSGDVEHAPVVVTRRNGEKAIVFATEFGEVRAVEPATGNTIWVQYHPQFDGWKPGKNRFVYRVGAAFRSGDIYFAPPFVADVNGDGVSDFVYSSRYGYDVISGQTGKRIYAIERPCSYFIRPHVLESSDGYILLHFATDWESKSTEITRYDLRSGRVIGRGELPFRMYPSTMQTPTADTWAQRVNGYIVRLQSSEQEADLIPTGEKLTVTSDFYGHQLMQFRGKKYVPMIAEYDWATHSSNFLLLDPVTWETAHQFTLPHTTESIPHLIDVDNDGVLELLYGCTNGTLYCHEIPQ